MVKLLKLINHKLVKGAKYFAGRNTYGRITVRHRGCIVKRNNYIIDYKRSLLNLNFIILYTRLIPKHSAYMNLILYENGLFSFIINSNNIINGKIIIANFFRNLSIGAYIPLYKAPYGTSIYNVELKLGFGGQIARAAGAFVKILNRFPNKYNKILLQFKSGEQYLINRNCGATLGVVSNINHWLKCWKKANMSKKLGYRSSVRGIAMNPVDHPHGGRTNGGRPSVTPKGLITKGQKTRKKQISKNIIFKRSKI